MKLFNGIIGIVAIAFVLSVNKERLRTVDALLLQMPLVASCSIFPGKMGSRQAALGVIKSSCSDRKCAILVRWSVPKMDVLLTVRHLRLSRTPRRLFSLPLWLYYGSVMGLLIRILAGIFPALNISKIRSFYRDLLFSSGRKVPAIVKPLLISSH